MANVNNQQRKQQGSSENQKRKLPAEWQSKEKKKKRKKDEKVVWYGFECPYCPQNSAIDSEKEVENKYLQRLVLCREKAYESKSKGHSLWVNFKAVHCRDFHSNECKYPLLKVKDGKVVSNESEGSQLGRKNLVKYELTRKQYSKRNVLNSKRKQTLQSEFFLHLPSNFLSIHNYKRVSSTSS